MWPSKLGDRAVIANISSRLMIMPVLKSQRNILITLKTTDYLFSLFISFANIFLIFLFFAFPFAITKLNATTQEGKRKRERENNQSIYEMPCMQMPKMGG